MEILNRLSGFASAASAMPKHSRIDSRKGAKAQSPRLMRLFFAPLGLCGNLHMMGTISKLPESNTSDNDQHVDPRISEPELRLLALAQSVARRLHPLRDDGRGRSSSWPRTSPDSGAASLLESEQTNSPVGEQNGCSDCLICQLHQNFATTLIIFRLVDPPAQLKVRSTTAVPPDVLSQIIGPTTGRAPPSIS